MAERKKIAAVVTTYFPGSHADVVITKFLKGFPTDEGLLPPKVDIVSMYMDQISEKDVGVDLAAEHGVPIHRSIPSALMLEEKELAVDGVLIIGEHGDYAWNEKEQHMYPRRFFLEQVCGIMAESGRSVPVFSDKHLAYDWENAKWMYGRVKALDVPFMAGSSIPLAWRDPWIEYDLDTPLEDALSVSYGGLDSYGFHALELLQCMTERRNGGETGITAVQCIEGEAVWAAAEEGLWSRTLLDAALARVEAKEPGNPEELCENPAVFLLEYADGFRAATLMLNGEVKAMEAATSKDPHPHFSYLSLNIQEMYLTGVPQYPAERTLLVTGALDALMDSRHRGHIRVETPHLDIAYRSYEKPPIRPSAPRPEGASLVPIVQR